MSDFIIVMDSGKEYGITYDEFLRYRNKRSTSGRAYPFFKLDSGTEIMIHKVSACEISEWKKPKREEGVPEPTLVPQPVKIAHSPDEDKKGIEEKEKEMLAEFMAKSNCTHENVSLNSQDTKTGLKYFPVCDFCGHRGRYIAADKLGDEEKALAIVWKEKQTAVA